jgi:8-oxo-dGTP pyrophosphatase MutT (NUDIX family)
VPRQAVSVLLLRGSNPWKVLLTRRPARSDFAPAVYVFPGGAVEGDDGEFSDRMRGAAIREVFEEVGILLAISSRGAATNEDADRIRQLTSQGLTMAAALQEADLRPAFEDMIYFARWITPELLRRRFDTRFYVAVSSPSYEVRPSPNEVEDWLWASPEQIFLEPALPMVTVSRQVLASAAISPDAEAVIGYHRGRRRIRAVRPTLRFDGRQYETAVPLRLTRKIRWLTSNLADLKV